MKSTTVAVLLFSALAIASPLHHHGQLRHKRSHFHHKRAELQQTRWRKTTTTVLVTRTLQPGESPPTPQVVVDLPTDVVPVVEPPASTSLTAVFVEVKPSVAKEQPAPAATTSTNAPAPTAASPATGGSGGANPFFPNGPKVGETHSGVRLSSWLDYWSPGFTFNAEGHIGACGHYPYLDTDQTLAKYSLKGDKKFMFHPPSISGNKYEDILQYCGAIIEVTTAGGLKTTGTVVDLCEDCGGEGGIDMLKANFEEVQKGNPADPVWGASWRITGWAVLKPAIG